MEGLAAIPWAAIFVAIMFCGMAPAQARCIRWDFSEGAVLEQPNGWTVHFVNKQHPKIYDGSPVEGDDPPHPAYVVDTRGVTRINGTITYLKMSVPDGDKSETVPLSFRLDWVDPKLGPWSTIYEFQILGARWGGGMAGDYGNERAYSPKTPNTVISWDFIPHNSVGCECYQSDFDDHGPHLCAYVTRAKQGH
jgi:hypothetical protein